MNKLSEVLFFSLNVSLLFFFSSSPELVVTSSVKQSASSVTIANFLKHRSRFDHAVFKNIIIVEVFVLYSELAA